MLNLKKSAKVADAKAPMKQNTIEDLYIQEPSDNSDKSFFFYEILTIALGFSNSILSYAQGSKTPLPLITSLSFFLLMIAISLVFYKLSKRFTHCTKVLHPIFFILTGFGIILTNPETFQVFGVSSQETYCPAMLQLILRVSLHTTFKLSINIHILSISFGILSIALKAYASQPLGPIFYLFCILLIICARFGVRCTKSSNFSTFSSKYELLDTVLDLDYGEIIIQLNLAIKSISKHAEAIKSSSLWSAVNDLQKIWLCLKKNKNIYNTNFEAVTKYMDDQDRAFIQQSCFIGFDRPYKTQRETIKIKEQQISYSMTELIGALSQIGKDWNFDTFFISNCSGQEPLKVMGMYAMCRYSLDQICGADLEKIEKFMKELESSYRENPYHNSAHSADVMVSYLYLVNNSDLVNHITSTELLSGILATLAHDAGHPGKTNRFLIMTQDPIATTYNDISVLENMHASILFNILKNEETNILFNFPLEKFFSIRKTVVEMILATDMAKHFDMMAQFRVKYYESDSMGLASQETRSDIFRIIMKAADIAHAAKSVELHEKWCRLVVEEFYEQGDLEKSLEIPVSMYCDRETTDISKSQAGFIKNIVYPLYSTLNSILHSEKIESSCLNQLRTNELYWTMRRKTIRGQSLIAKTEEYVNVFNSLHESRRSIRKPSLPEYSKNKR